MLFAEAAVFRGVGAIDVAGGAALGADHLAVHVVDGLNVGVLRHDDDLHALGVAVGEVHDGLALFVHGHASHDHVALAVLGGQQGGVEVHVIDLQLQAQLLGDGVSHFDVDALEAAVVCDHFIGGELGVGGHGELAGGDGGQVPSSLGGGSAVVSVGSGIRGGLTAVAAAACQGQHADQHRGGHQDRKQFFHDTVTSFHFCSAFTRSRTEHIIHSMQSPCKAFS